MSIFPAARFAMPRPWLLPVVVAGLAGLGLLACEGPTGPEGPQGEQGPPGPAGADPSIINLDLSNHVQGTTFDRGSNTLTPKNDTLSIKWGATMDTTITSVTVADSQYAAVYVRVPGVGFQRAPVRFNVDGTQNVSDVVQEADPFAQVEYNLLRQLPSPARDSFFAADAVGGTDRRFYTAVTDRFDIHEAVVEPGEFAVTVRAYEAEDGSEYESGIAEGFTSPLVPFDNDLSDTSPNNYPNANSSGEIEYRQVATDLGAIRNAVGTNLRLEKYELRAVKQGSFGPVSRFADWRANPRTSRVEVRAAWERDSISVAAVVIGTNYGRDRTIYTQRIPMDVRISVVGGELADKMWSGRPVGFSEVKKAVRR